jgi:mannosyltransferase OCH1-like enzyme
MTAQSDRIIPRVVHQLAIGQAVPPSLATVRAALIDANPGWDFRLYDGEAVERFIAAQYGADMLARYHRLRPEYGAARADLARYLIVYRLGGLYLDLKSTVDRPLEEVVRPDDQYLLSQWRNRRGEEHFTWGLHRELVDVPGGALQQWFVASAPGHPFLRAVIDEVCARIDRYDPWRDGVGGTGVFHVTGPIAYTRAIWPIRHDAPHRLLVNEREAGLVYSTITGLSHRALSTSHYARRREPLVGTTPTGIKAAMLTARQQRRDRGEVWWLRWQRLTGRL